MCNCNKTEEEKEDCGCQKVLKTCEDPCKKCTKKLSTDSIYYEGDEFCMIALPVGSCLSEVIKWIDTRMCVEDGLTVLNTNIGAGIGVYSGTNTITGHEEFYSLLGSESIDVGLADDSIVFNVNNEWFTNNVSSIINEIIDDTLNTINEGDIINIGAGSVDIFKGRNSEGQNELKTIKGTDTVKVSEINDTICFDVDTTNILNDITLGLNGTKLNLVINGVVVSTLDLCPVVHSCFENNPDVFCDLVAGCDSGTNTCNISAGVDRTISIPVDALTLTGSTTSTGYTVWTKVSGGSATIDSPNSLTTTVSELEAGNYVFQLTMTDDDGNTCVDTVSVQVSVINSNTYEIGVGNCDVLPTNWVTVYTTANIPLMNGDVLYTDPALTVPYIGGNNGYRVRLSGGFVTNQQFGVTNGGVVINELSCKTPVTISALTEKEEDDCWTYQCFEINVPEGESRTVTINKAGIGLYSTVYAGTCLGATPVTSNIVETISNNKTYFINIAGGNTGGGIGVTTTVTLTVTGGAVPESVTLTRLVSTPYIPCLE